MSGFALVGSVFGLGVAGLDPFGAQPVADRGGGDASARANRNLRAERLPTSHAAVREQPDRLAAPIEEFLA